MNSAARSAGRRMLQQAFLQMHKKLKSENIHREASILQSNNIHTEANIPKRVFFGFNRARRVPPHVSEIVPLNAQGVNNRAHGALGAYSRWPLEPLGTGHGPCFV